MIEKFKENVNKTLSVYSMSDWSNIDIPNVEFLRLGVGNLDNIIPGFCRGGISVVCGGSGMGKSFALLHIAAALSREYKILYVSIENAIQVDFGRMGNIPEKYSINEDQFYYANVPFDDISYNDAQKSITDLINTKGKLFDALIIDGGDILVNGDDGAAQYSNGNRIMQWLKTIAESHNMAVLISWQLHREGSKKPIVDIDTSDMATSMGIARYASLILAVKADKKCHTWQMRPIKCRFDYVDTPIDVVGFDGKFNLCCYDIGASNKFSE